MVASKRKAQQQSSLWEARKRQWLEQADSEIDKIGEKNPMEYPVIDPQTEQPVGSRKIEIIVIEPRGSQVGMPPAPNPPLDSDDSSEDESDQEEQATGWKTYYCPPTIHEAEAALQKIDQAVWTPRPSGGYLYAKLDWVTNERYSAIKACLNQFLMASPKGKRFIEVSKDAAQVQGRKETYAQTIRKWTQHFIQTGCLPSNHQGWWNVSILEDEDISGKIKLHLQQIGKLACAQDVVKFLQDPQVRDWLGITKKISMWTAQRWLSHAGFRWHSEPKGQYFDRHERKDVVTYRQQTYIPFIKALEQRQTIYNWDGIPDPTCPMRLFPGEKPVIIWFHNESIFYANDRQMVWWVYIGEHPTLFKKGEGCSIMIANFVCAELGWLCGQNGELARVAMYPGANKDGYFMNKCVVLQLQDAIKIVQEHFPQFTHVFVYNNAPCHTKYSTSLLCAQGMPKGPLMDWPYYKDAENNQVFVLMEDGQLPNGSLQSFYDPKNPWRFKGMAWILKERRLAHISKKNTQCTNFKCPKGKTDCCCRRAMVNQPDFKSRDSCLQETARKLGTQVMFLPKYHCELTLIEQIWGRAKRSYRDYPLSSNPKVLKENALKAVDGVELLSMQKFGARSERFVDGYHSGLSGSQAIDWATKKFKHHRGPPEHIHFDNIAPGYVHTNEIE